MKLNNKRTILVGFAFFLICAFWQIYDVTIAMTLTSKFGLSVPLVREPYYIHPFAL